MQKEINELGKTVQEQSNQLVEKDQVLTEQTKQLTENARQKQLYALLGSEQRWGDLSRALQDENFCKQLLEEYQIE